MRLVVRFPHGTRNLTAHFSGGFIADITQRYTFECSREETNRLIRELGLVRRDPPAVTNDWVKPELWGDGDPWRPTSLTGHPDFLELLTDESHTQVYIICGTI